ncbi:MAG: PTS transporter subunit EIIC [Erysipelotrichaceae bacterium]|nr:PTS transporter subunit EIIC [Erysipelotrichaceae bacterium]
MKNYESMCEKILSAVGGTENITDCYHCFTRLRIAVADPSKVDKEALEKSGIMKLVVSGNQYQCVIGTDVQDVYPQFCKLAGLKEKPAVEENVETVKTKKKLTLKTVFDTIIDAVSGCIQPLITGIICGGMIKMVVSILGPSILGIVPEGSDLLNILTMAGDAPFYFLPVMIGYTGAKKFGLNPVTGMILGALLFHPTYTGMVAAGQAFKVYGIPASLVDYSSSVVPMILVTWIASYIEKFLNKYIPNMVKMMAVMPLTVLIMLPLEFCVLAPLGNNLGTALSSIILAIPNYLGGLGIGFIGAIYIILVMTGMHLPVIMAVAPTYFALGHEDVVLASGVPATMACCGLALAFFLRSKKNENRQLGFSCFTSNLFGGVSEPICYGILLPYKKAWLWQAIGAFAGAAIIGFTKTGFYTITSGASFISWMSFVGGSKMNMVWGIIALVVSFLVPFVLTLILGYGEEK